MISRAASTILALADSATNRMSLKAVDEPLAVKFSLRPPPFARMEAFTGALAVLVGGVVLAGWSLDIAALKSVLPGWVSMKPNTAVAFVLTGIALGLSRPAPTPNAQRSAVRTPLARLCGELAGVIGALSLAEFAFGWNPGFDQWLFPEPAGTVGTSNPGRMAPDTALCFVLLAVGLEFIRRPHQARRGRVAAGILGALVTIVGFIEIASYFTPTLRTFGWGGLTMMALPTAVLFVALGAVLVAIVAPRNVPGSDRPVPSLASSFDAVGIRLLLVFAGLSAGIVAAGTFYYRVSERNLRIEFERRLASVADLKVAQLVEWRRERMADGMVLFNNRSFAALARRLLARPSDADAQRQLQDWLQSYRSAYRYEQVRLIDANGVPRLTLPQRAFPLSAVTRQLVAEAQRSGQPVWQDFYRNEYDQRVYLQIHVPLFDAENANRPLGAISLRIDPTTFLYPFIQRWPVPSRSAETLLIRRDGDEVVFLNTLRFDAAAALTQRAPTSSVALLAARAVRGEVGPVEGMDYRKTKVVGELRPVPGSPWFLVAKEDHDEAFAPVLRLLWQVVAMIGALLLATGAGVSLEWRRQRARFDRGLASAADALRENELKFRTLFETTQDAHLLFADGHWIDCNAAAARVFGCTREQIIGAHPSRFSPPMQPDGRKSEAEAIQRINLAFSAGPQTFEWEHCRADGTRFPAEVSLSRIDLGGRPHIQAIVRDISERKQSEQALKSEKANLDALFESSPVALLVLDHTTAIVRVNLAALALTGGSESEFLRHRPGNALRCVNSQTDPRGCGYGAECPLCPARNGIEALIVSGGSMHGAEIPLRLIRNGVPEDVFLRMGAEPVMVDGVQHLMVAMDDITDRKRAAMVTAAQLHLVDFAVGHSLDEVLEETLNEAEKLSGSLIGFYHFVEADQVTLTLQNWSTRTKADYCRAEAKGSHYGIDQAGVWVDCVRQRKPVIHNDYAALPHRKGLPEGHAALIRQLVVPVMQGEQVMAILGVGNKPFDYTSVDVATLSDLAELAWQVAVRTRAEEALRKTQDLLTQAEQLGKVGGWEFNIDTQQQTWTKTVYDIHELDSTGQPTVDQGISYYTPESQPIIARAVQRAIEHGEPFDLELEIVTAKGHRRSVHAMGHPDLARGKVTGFFQDITERKLAEVKIRELNTGLEKRVAERTAELTAANAELESFSYSVSHDLRAPLRSLDGFSRIVLEDYTAKLDEEGRDSLNRIRAAAQKMGQLIEDLLSLSRVTRTELRRERVDLSAAAREVAAELRFQEPGRQAAVLVADGLVAEGDPNLLRVVLTNLLANAWKFTGRRADARIEFGATSESGRATYFVRDNGAGFDPQYASKLFGAFQRMHSSTEFPGTGIGLATVQRIIHRHGGRIWAEAAVDEGATFHFVLGART